MFFFLFFWNFRLSWKYRGRLGRQGPRVPFLSKLKVCKTTWFFIFLLVLVPNLLAELFWEKNSLHEIDSSLISGWQFLARAIFVRLEQLSWNFHRKKTFKKWTRDKEDETMELFTGNCKPCDLRKYTVADEVKKWIFRTTEKGIILLCRHQKFNLACVTILLWTPMCVGASRTPFGQNAMSMCEIILLFQQSEEIEEQFKEAVK